MTRDIQPPSSAAEQVPSDRERSVAGTYLGKLLKQPGPVLALAPMQDVTDLPFMRLMAQFGGADLYFTEYFRVHVTSCLDKPILRSITENPTGRPIIAQMIGNDIPALVRSARALQQYPIAGVDLNLGCPAPVVYRKCAGGGLLRELNRVDSILGALRDAVSIPFTVKTRVGFDSIDDYEEMLRIFSRHSLDLLSVHGRTVKEMYRPGVRYDLIARAVEVVGCPVLANGYIDSAEKARAVMTRTGARGVMLGRGAIRNPWLFDQIRRACKGETQASPRGRDVLHYIRELYQAVMFTEYNESRHVQKMKKYMNYVAMGIEPLGQFLHQIRRVNTETEFFRVCVEFLDHDEPMALSADFQPAPV